MANNKETVNNAFKTITGIVDKWMYIDSTFMTETFQAVYEEDQLAEMDFACARASETIDRLTGMAIGTDLSLLTDLTNPATKMLVTKDTRIKLVCFATANLAWQFFQNGFDYGNGSVSIGIGGMSASQVKLGKKTIDIPEIVFDLLTEALLYQRVTPSYMNIDPVNLLGNTNNGFYNLDPTTQLAPDAQPILWGEGKAYFSPQLIAGDNVTLSTTNVGNLPKIKIDANLDPTIIDSKLAVALEPVNQNITTLSNNITTLDTKVNSNKTDIENKLTPINQNIATTNSNLTTLGTYSQNERNRIEFESKARDNYLTAQLSNPQLQSFAFEPVDNTVDGLLVGTIGTTKDTQGNPLDNALNLFSPIVLTNNNKRVITNVEPIDLLGTKKQTLLQIQANSIALNTPIQFDIPNFFIVAGIQNNSFLTFTSPIVEGPHIVRNNISTNKFYNFNAKYENSPLSPDFYNPVTIPSLRLKPQSPNTGKLWLENNLTSLPVKLSSLVRPQVIDQTTGLITINNLAIDLSIYTYDFNYIVSGQSRGRGIVEIKYEASSRSIVFITNWLIGYTPNLPTPLYFLTYLKTKNLSYLQVAPRIGTGGGASTNISSLDGTIEVRDLVGGYDIGLPQATQEQINKIGTIESTANSGVAKGDTAQATANTAQASATSANQKIDNYNLWNKTYTTADEKTTFKLEPLNKTIGIENTSVSNFFDEDLNQTIISNNNISILNKNIASLPTKVFETKITRGATSQFFQNNRAETIWRSIEVDRQTQEVITQEEINIWDLNNKVKTIEATTSKNVTFYNTSTSNLQILSSNNNKIYNITDRFFSNTSNAINEGVLGVNGYLTYDSVNQRLIPNENSVGKNLQLTISLIHDNPSLTAGDSVTFAIGLNSVLNNNTTVYDNGPIFTNTTLLTTLTLVPLKYYNERILLDFFIPKLATDESRVNGFKICVINRNNTAYDFNNMKIKILGTVG